MDEQNVNGAAAEAGSEATGTDAGETTAPAVDLSPLENQLEGLAGRLDRFLETQQPKEEENSEEENFEPESRLPAQDFASAEEAREAIEQYVDGLVQERLEHAMQGVGKTLEDKITPLEIERAISSLEQKYPAVAGEDGNGWEEILDLAEERAEALGVENPYNPTFIEETLLAKIGRDSISNERPAGKQEHVSLEGGTGAAPGDAGEQEENIGAQILAAGGSSNGLW